MKSIHGKFMVQGYRSSHCILVLYIIKTKQKIERLFWNQFRRHSQIHQINYLTLEVFLQDNPNTLLFNLIYHFKLRNLPFPIKPAFECTVQSFKTDIHVNMISSISPPYTALPFHILLKCPFSVSEMTVFWSRISRILLLVRVQEHLP